MPARLTVDSRRVAIASALGFVGVLVIGYADYATGPDILLSLLYLVVIAPVAWWGGRVAGAITAVASSIAWSIAAFATTDLDPRIGAWNAASRTVIFISAALLLGALRIEQGRLRLVDREREEFLSFIAHELRQPVASIDVAASGLASSPRLDPAEKRVLTGLRSQARRLTTLAEDLLSIGRLEGGLVLTPAEVDLCTVVASVIHDCEDPSRVDLDGTACPVAVLGDALRLTQAVDNLVSNALKYSPPGAKVTVSVRASGDSGRVDVIDHGLGVDPKDLDRLFRKYGRLEDPARANAPGAGLGLYLVRLIAESHGGRAYASSEGRGKGSTFSLEVPLRLAAR